MSACGSGSVNVYDSDNDTMGRDSGTVNCWR